jgi:hypothetical protein
MTWINASLRGVAIFGYFVVATVWLPDFVLKLDSVASASSFIRDLVVLVLWGGGFVGGLWLLRFGQRKGLV